MNTQYKMCVDLSNVSIDLSFLAEDLAFLASGHDKAYVQAHPEEFEPYTVALAFVLEDIETRVRAVVNEAEES